MRILSSPGKYIQGVNILKEIPSYIKGFTDKDIYCLVSSFIFEQYSLKMKKLFAQAGIGMQIEAFNGACCMQEIERVTERLQQHSCGAVMGFGGGTVIDAAKAVAYFLKISCVIVPTAASMDGPCSGLSVLYHPDGTLDRYLYLDRSPELVAVDIAMIANAPPRLLAAGMGDALATYYEARACFKSGAAAENGGRGSVSAQAVAKACRDVILQNGEAALRECQEKTPGQALEDVVEANLYMSCFGFECGGLAMAHAVSNGLSRVGLGKMHGENVAFGLIVQLEAEGNHKEKEKVKNFFKNIGLPYTWKQITDHCNAEIIKKTIWEITKERGIHNMPFAISQEMIEACIMKNIA